MDHPVIALTDEQLAALTASIMFAGCLGSIQHRYKSQDEALADCLKHARRLLRESKAEKS